MHYGTIISDGWCKGALQYSHFRWMVLGTTPVPSFQMDGARGHYSTPTLDGWCTGPHHETTQVQESVEHLVSSAFAWTKSLHRMKLHKSNAAAWKFSRVTQFHINGMRCSHITHNIITPLGDIIIDPLGYNTIKGKIHPDQR